MSTPIVSSFSVPEEQSEALAYLASFDAVRQGMLLDRLRGLDAQTFTLGKMESLLRDFADDEHSSSLLASAVQSFHNTRERFAQLSDAQFVEKTLGGALSNPGIHVDPDLLRNVLTNLLGLRNVALSVKATRVLLDVERHMSDVMAYTDMRPLFDHSGTSIEAYVLVHTLKIEYSDDVAQREFYIRIDDADIEALAEAVSRLRTKSKAIKETAAIAGIRLIGDTP